MESAGEKTLSEEKEAKKKVSNFTSIVNYRGAKRGELYLFPLKTIPSLDYAKYVGKNTNRS
jgi:hypothetical protein